MTINFAILLHSNNSGYKILEVCLEISELEIFTMGAHFENRFSVHRVIVNTNCVVSEKLFCITFCLRHNTFIFLFFRDFFGVVF